MLKRARRGSSPRKTEIKSQTAREMFGRGLAYVQFMIAATNHILLVTRTSDQTVGSGKNSRTS
jgi:hypothetical protein